MPPIPQRHAYGPGQALSVRAEAARVSRIPRPRPTPLNARRATGTASLSRGPNLPMTNKNRPNNLADNGSSGASAKTTPNNHEGTPSPSPFNLTLPQTAELFPPLSLFDISTQRIHKLVFDSRKLHLTRREQLRQLVEILMPGTKAISISRLETLLAWPHLQSAWELFVRDVLEHPSSTPNLQPTNTCHRFSTILLNPISPTTAASHPTPPAPRYRPIHPTHPTPQSNLLTTLRNLFHPASPHHVAHHNSPLSDEYTSDTGFPNPSLLPHRLLAGLCQSRPLDLAHTSPVNADVLAEWHCQTHDSNNRGEVTGCCWRRTGRGWEERACSVEDYYARFVLWVLDGVYQLAGFPPLPFVPVSRGHHGETQKQGQSAGGWVHPAPRDQRKRERDDDENTRRWRKRVEWLRDPAEVGGLKEQMWILFHVLFFLHCEKREEIRAAQKAERRGWVKSLFCWRG